MKIGLLRAKLAVLALLAVSGIADAHEYKVKDLTIGHPWARATIGGLKTGVVYVTFVNDGARDDALLKVSSPLAEMIMMHSTVKDGDIVRMRDLDSLALPAHQTTEMKPGGMHIMLMGLKQPLKEGDMFPLTFTLANEGEVAVEVMVSDAE